MGDHFINGTNFSYEQMAREKKLSKLSIFFAMIGMITGLTFTFIFSHSYFAPLISLSSGNCFNGRFYLKIIVNILFN